MPTAAADAPKVAVSIIVPHFNRNDRLAGLLAMLERQTFQDWELVIVDDASAVDPTAAVAALAPPARARVARMEKNAGPAAARNAGLAAARGRFVAFLDSDDAWAPEKLQRQVALVLSRPDPESVICTTRARVTGTAEAGQVRPARLPGPDERAADFLFLKDGFAQTSSFFLARSAARAVGWEAGLRQFEDYLFLMACQGRGLTHHMLDEPLTEWLHDDRADRLSRGDQRNLDNARRFIAAAGPLLTPRERLAFQVKDLASVYLQRQPLAGVALVIRAALSGVIGPRRAAGLLLEAFLPPSAFANLRAKAVKI